MLPRWRVGEGTVVCLPLLLLTHGGQAYSRCCDRPLGLNHLLLKRSWRAERTLNAEHQWNRPR